MDLASTCWRTWSWTVPPTSRAFSENDGALLSALGDYAAIAIENARNFQQLEEIKEREKMEIRGAFERYVAPSVVDRVLHNPDEMGLGGHRRVISVLFADIRGYTTFSAYAWEALTLAQDGAFLRAAVYVVASNAVGLLGVWLGSVMGRLI